MKKKEKLGYVITSKITKTLPIEYQEVEYIESTGTQYINTKFIPSGNAFRIIISFKYTNNHDRLSLFGNSYQLPSCLTVYGSVPTFWVGNSGGINCGSQTDDNTIYTLDVEAYNGNLNAIWNGVKTTKSYTGDLNNKNEYYIFGNNSSTGELKETDKGYRLFSFKMYDNNIMVRDYIPCYRKEDNVIGLYDLVNQKFYTNSGTGVFIKGEDKNTIIASENEDYIVEEDYIFNMSETEEDKFKSLYQQVEYLSSTGTQYINTGIKATEKTVVEVDTVSVNDYSVFGDRGSGSSMFNLTGNTTRSFRWGSQTKNATGYSCQERAVISFGQKVYLNGTLIIEYNPEIFTTNEIYLFSRVGGDDRGNVTIYYAKFYEDNTLVAHFIPCYRKTDGVVGLYDLVNDKFYTNAGTGTFEKGADVN